MGYFAAKVSEVLEKTLLVPSFIISLYQSLYQEVFVSFLHLYLFKDFV